MTEQVKREVLIRVKSLYFLMFCDGGRFYKGEKESERLD